MTDTQPTERDMLDLLLRRYTDIRRGTNRGPMDPRGAVVQTLADMQLPATVDLATA